MKIYTYGTMNLIEAEDVIKYLKKNSTINNNKQIAKIKREIKNHPMRKGMKS